MVRKFDNMEYIQVAASVIDEAAFSREIMPLRKVKKSYPKMILTMDRVKVGNYDGIRVVNVMDCLLERV